MSVPIPIVQRFVAIVGITASVVRGNEAGVAELIRGYLMRLPLDQFSTRNPAEFRERLDRATVDLQYILPNKSWGLARKSLNIFLRDSLYNFYLRTEFDLVQAEQHYEMPLDSIVAGGLKKEAKETGRGKLPSWPGLKGLTVQVSDRFQEFANVIATQKRVARVHLDVEIWASGRPFPRV